MKDGADLAAGAIPSRILSEDLDRSLSEFFASGSVKNGQFVANVLAKLEENKSKDITAFIEKIVDGIVFGPAQEVFSGQEIITAIESSKAASFIEAFSNLSDRIVSIATDETRDECYSTFKDFRDVFVMSVFSSIVSDRKGIQKENLLKGIFSDDLFADLSESDLHGQLVNFFYNHMPEEDSGAITLAMLIHRTLMPQENNDYLKWTRAKNIDSIFNY